LLITTCPFCGVGCSADVVLKSNKKIKVTGNINGVNAGNLCVKGKTGLDFVTSDHRITEPLIKKDGEFFPVSWDEALSTVAEKLAMYKHQFGGDALAVIGSARCTNEDNFLFQKFGRAVLGTNNVDNNART